MELVAVAVAVIVAVMLVFLLQCAMPLTSDLNAALICQWYHLHISAALNDKLQVMLRI